MGLLGVQSDKFKEVLLSMGMSGLKLIVKIMSKLISAMNALKTMAELSAAVVEAMLK